jgi:hypothetical protein
MPDSNYKVKIDLDKLFPEDWYENVTKVTNYVLNNMNIPDEDIDSVASYIVEYNINKQMDDKLLNCISYDLPEYLSFVDAPSTEVFSEFKNILDICDACPAFREHIIYFQTDDLERNKRTLNLWKSLAKKDFPHLILLLKELKSQDCIRLIIRKK